jgi:PAS domain S-box-containing protein
MFAEGIIKVLLVEDDEDDFVITRELISEIRGQKFTLDWVKTFEAGLAAMKLSQHDVVLVDFRLGAHNGVQLLRAAVEAGCESPIILLTGSGEHTVDVQAMEAGASDYLVKAELSASQLERSIRYALQRRRATALAAFEQARLAAFGADVGLALTRHDSLEAILERCAAAMARYLNAAVARISVFDGRTGKFTSKAAAGALVERSKGAPAAKVELELGPLLEGKPLVIKRLGGDSRVPDQDWVQRESLCSYAAFPLILEERLVGLMSIFTEHPLTEQIIQEMGSVANGISLCIERKRSAQALDASESNYRTMVENIREVIFQLDEFGCWSFLNPAWTTVTEFEAKSCVGSFFIHYLHEEDREVNRHIFLQLVQRKLDYCRYETRFLTRDGRIRWVEVFAQPTLNSDGTVHGISGSLTDITERKTAESAIQKLAAFPKVNPNPVLEFAADGTLSYANEAARDVAKSLGKEDLLTILPAEAGTIARNCLALGQKRLREEVCLNGRTFTWSFFPIAGSQVVHCYGFDVTDMLNLEAQFRHAQKLESVGQLAAGVAHDFNNILTIIQGYAECLLVKLNRDATVATPLNQIAGAAKRAAALTRQLLLFSRKQVIQTRVVDLNTVLQNLATMLTRLLGEDIALETSYAADLPCVQADAGMLEQIGMNLAVNSRDAMPRGGKLFIGTKRVAIDEEYACLHPDSRPGQFVCLTVRDTGCGMDRKTLERIFEPFFSTKEVGKGTGLGLATVYGIVKQHQGWTEVSSEVGMGTTFRIYLPAIVANADSQADSAETMEPVLGGHETIMVVEDEPVLRELVREVLQEHHYRVVEAGSGVEALRLWDEFDGKIDLVLTDMVMPEGISGRELAEHLKRRKPQLKVIYSSGYSPETIGKDFGAANDIFLSKPYLPPQLVRAVRQTLDGPRMRGPKTEVHQC